MVVSNVMSLVLGELNFNPKSAANLAVQTWTWHTFTIFIPFCLYQYNNGVGARAKKKTIHQPLHLLSTNYVTDIVSFS